MRVLAILVCLVALGHGNFVSNTLLKLGDILKGMDMEGILGDVSTTDIKSNLFKFYHDDLLPLQFKLWKEHHGKMYGSDEEHETRAKIWAENVKFIHEHNKKAKSYTVEMNHFGDMTEAEYKAMLGTKIFKKTPDHVLRGPVMSNLPASVDWRKEGYVTDVKNQGQCGSCWSFSSTGAMEGLHMKKTGTLVSLSEQNLVDCSGSYGNMGCNGGLMDQAFQYVIDNGGIDTETSYPYEGVEGTCRFNKTDTALKLTSFKDVPSGSEAALQAALAQQGPVSIAIDAGHSSFQFYSGGVYDEIECSSEQLDHGVLAVGYGTDATTGADFWIVKNSWSAGWGEDGFIMMSRNKQNQCGVATAASFPL